MPAEGRPRPPLPGGPYLVVGLARSGVAAAVTLHERGEQVIGCDSGPPGAAGLDDAAAQLTAAGIETHLGGPGTELVTRAATLVKSPGVPREAPVVQAALQRGLTVCGELELGWRLVPNRFIAVTGTNGKTTTTEWIGHIHREAGAPVVVAGNVGTALTSLAATVPAAATIVCEASSFQLQDTLAFAPEVAVLLNLAPDHLDRHGSYENYIAAKLRIFAHQGNDDVAIAPLDLPVQDLGGCARRVPFGPGPGPELSERAGQLWWDEAPLLATAEISLPGEHNRLNAMAAAAACLASGVDAEAVAAGLRTFHGVPHRLELVATRGGVAYVNDSKATNVASAIVALRSYPGGVHLIAGGRGKSQDFASLAPLVAERCRAAYLIGEAATELAAALEPSGTALVQAGDMEAAVRAAEAAAGAGDTILLSPACASYDQYTDFERRGDHFRELAGGD